MGDMQIALGLLIIVATVGTISALARRWSLSAPLVLVVVGVLASFLPYVPDVEVPSEVVLVGILPPLLFGAALKTSLIDFKANRRPIGLLSVGYVLFATATVGIVVHLLLPDVPLAGAFALGAAVAPPDAVAATAVARKVGLPRRLIVILEGESLVNDATALVCFRTALAALIGTTPSWWKVGGQFLYTAAGAVVVGVLVAIVLIWIRKRVTDVVLNTTLSLASPYAAFLPAEAAHVSGVLAVVVAGLLIGHKAPSMPSGASRVSERINWSTVEFLLENSVFLLIGLQVRHIVVDAFSDPLGNGRILTSVLVILLAVLVLRPLWMFPATYLPRLIPAVRRVDPFPPWQYPAVLSWAGMRGVVTVATVLALPAGLSHRAVLVLAALVVVGGTLLLQGLTLPRVVRALGLRGPDAREDALATAAVMREATQAGLAELDRLKKEDETPEVLALIARRTEERDQQAWERLGRPESEGPTPSQRYLQLRLGMLAAERDKVLQIRDDGGAAQEVLREVLLRLDVEESMLDASLADDEELTGEGQLTAPAEIAATPDCEHLADATDQPVPDDPQCLDCLREGTSWVHLRMCLTCANVGCCDSSAAKHADRHFRDTEHPVMRSVEPGEAWRWCYVDDQLG